MKYLLLMLLLLMSFSVSSHPIDRDLQAVILHPEYAQIIHQAQLMTQQMGQEWVTTLGESFRAISDSGHYYFYLPVVAVRPSLLLSHSRQIGMIVSVHRMNKQQHLPMIRNLSYRPAHLPPSF
jgi:hypothetical protein